MRWLGPLAVVVLIASFATACGSTTTGANGATAGAVRLSAATDHACIVGADPKPVVDWAQLHNPLLSFPDAAVKDQALVWALGSWHLLFSYVTNNTVIPGDEHWDIAAAESTDFVHWSAPSPWSEQPGGMASPDVVRAPSGEFVSTYDSPPGETGPAQAKLYFRTSSDLVHWSAPQPLAPALYPSPGVRMIDPALAWTGNGLILGYKVGTTSQTQTFEIAWSKSGSLYGPWVVIGRPGIRAYGDTFENYEFLSIDGRWRLVATSNTFDQPWIFTLAAKSADPESWLHWEDGHELRVPSQEWNTGSGLSSVNFEHANSAFICQDAVSGYTYLTYAGSQELTQFGGWGHAEIGVVRSRDLVHWSVPPK